MSVSLRQSTTVSTGTTAVSSNFGSTTLSGSMLVYAVATIQDSPSSSDGPPTINLPTTTGFTWIAGPTSSAPQATEGSHHYTETVSIFYIPNAAAMSSGLSVLVTITPTGSGTVSSGAQLMEVTGLSVSPLDVYATASHPPAAQFTTAGNITTSSDGIIIEIVTNPNYNTQYVAGTGYTKLFAGSGPGISSWGVIQYQITPSAGMYSTDWGPAVGQNGPWATAVAAFKTTQPILQVSPSSLSFSAAQGGANPSTQNLSISNGNGGTLSWSFVSDSAWLLPASGSGTDTGTVTVAPNISGLTQGTYTGHLTFTASGAVDSPTVITVTLTVSAPSAVLKLSPSTLTFTGTPGGSNPGNKLVLVSNTGTPGTMSFTVSDDADWLTVSPTSGDAGTTPVSLTVSANIVGLSQGAHSATITVTSAAANNSPQTVSVTLFIVDVFHYVKSVQLNNGQRTIAFDKSGTLWEENVVTDPLVLHPLLPTFAPSSYMASTTQADVEYMCVSDLQNGTDIPRQYNPQPATGGYTLDRVSQSGPGAPPTFQPTASAGSSATITAWAGVGTVVTFQAINSFTAGEIVTLSGFATSTFFNNLSFSVLGTGLSGTQFEISFSGFSGGTDSGVATPQYGYRLSGITQPPSKSSPSVPGHFDGILWSAGPQSRDPGNTISVFYADRSTGEAQDTLLVNTFNSGIATYVYIAGAPFGNGTHLVTSVGSAVPPGADDSHWYFTFQVISDNSQSGGSHPPGTYQQSLASVTMLDPIPNLSVGDQVTMVGASPSAWNAAWTVVQTLNSGIYNISQTSMTAGVATYTWAWAGSGAPVAPTVGQLVTVIQTLNGNGIFNVVEAPIASVSGGPSNGTFTVGNFTNQTIPAAAETGQAQTSGTRFQIDPGALYVDTNTSPIFGNAITAGVVVIVGSNNQVGPGTRQAVVFFETREGLKTACSAPITFTTDSAATYILASNIPIGPPNVIRRWIAFTGAGPNGIAGPNFYTIDTPITYTISNQTYRYSATYIDDNVTTTAKFTFTDAILLAGEEIDVQGNNLFNQIELGSSVWNIAYANRMLYGLEQNKVLNFNNLSFDGGYLPTPSGPVYPLGWGIDPTSNSGVGAAATITAFKIVSNVVTITANNNFTAGIQVLITGLTTGTYLNGQFFTIIFATATTFTVSLTHADVTLTSDSGTATPVFTGANLRVSPIFGNSYYISNQLGSTQSALGMIIQNAYQDAYNVPIILPNVLYSVRVTARIPSGKTTGSLVVDLTDSNAGNASGTGTNTYGITYGSYELPFASMTATMATFTGTLLTTPFTQGVPTGLLLRYWAKNIGDGNDVEIDRIEIFPTIAPTLTTNIRCSYIDNFEAFDAVTGNIGLAAFNTQPALGAFILHDTLYFLKTGSMDETNDVPSAEPSSWSVREVSNRVGTCGIHAYDYGEEWVVTACRNGVYGFNGGQPIRIDFQQKEIWESINWEYGHTIWLRNDLPNRRLLCGVPLPTPNRWLPEAPTNASPTTPNVVILWNYQGLGDFQELVSGKGMHTTMFGNLVSTDMRLKCSLWNITSPYAGFITQPDLNSQKMLLCDGVNPGVISRLDPTQLSDNGVAINSRYFTYGFVNSAKATEYPLLGFHRKTFNGLQVLVTGSGAVSLKAYPNYILTPSTLNYNPYVYSVPSFVLVEQPTDDYWRPLNITGNRVYFSAGTNAVGAAFNLSKMIAVGVIAPYAAVNPNV